MQFFNKVKTELSSGVPNAEAIRAYCNKRIAHIDASLPYLELHEAVFPSYFRSLSYTAQRQIELLRAVIEQLDNQESTELKIANIRHLAGLQGIRPYGRDILALLEGRAPELPEQLRDIPQFLKAEEARKELERQQRVWEARARREAQKEAELQRQAQEERRKFAEKLRIPPEALDKLATS